MNELCSHRTRIFHPASTCMSFRFVLVILRTLTRSHAKLDGAVRAQFGLMQKPRKIWRSQGCISEESAKSTSLRSTGLAGAHFSRGKMVASTTCYRAAKPLLKWAGAAALDTHGGLPRRGESGGSRPECPKFRDGLVPIG